MSINVLGIRHHGPGCARSLQLALEAMQPDIVLVEGPPDAQDALPLLTHQEMEPPVALLIYVPDEPRRSVYYPFTMFSPEWQALRYSQEHNIPARFMDLPQSIRFAREKEQASKTTEEQPPEGAQPLDTLVPDSDPQPRSDNPLRLSQGEQPISDPISLLGSAAGYDDPELWWEHQIEQRHDMTDLFQGILEAMCELRGKEPPNSLEEAQREAHMRQTIRAAQQEGYQRIAVVCGAWHAPVLIEPGPADEDVALLKGLKRVKIEATWIPWTNSRLAYRSGYGAGIASPGWYEHVWHYPESISVRWVSRAAHLLRDQGRDTSSANVIEAVRLGDTLAALRDLPMAGLAELHEAIQTTLCNSEKEPMQLIRDRLEIGERLGHVPAETPVVPLQRDLENKQRRLRLKPSPEKTMLDLDLRKDTDRARSQLLHQLSLLKIPWGETQHSSGKSGTFHEYWRMQWQVEFAVAVIEANVWGNTVEQAASAFVCHAADKAEELPRLSQLLDASILADLPEAVEHVLQAIQRQAAIASDVRHLMDSLPPLARVARYGNVRGTKTERLQPVINGLFERILIGLPGACASLDDDAARLMLTSIDHVQESVNMLDLQEQREAWQMRLRSLVEQENGHGLLRGRCCRLLLEQGVIDATEMQLLAGLALSPVTPTTQAAAWIEGVLRGGGERIIHLNELWRSLDSWLKELPTETFTALVPILRRAFSSFQAPDRRRMGEKIKHLHTPANSLQQQQAGTNGHIDHERAERVLPVLAQILGVSYGS